MFPEIFLPDIMSLSINRVNKNMKAQHKGSYISPIHIYAFLSSEDFVSYRKKTVRETHVTQGKSETSENKLKIILL